MEEYPRLVWHGQNDISQVWVLCQTLDCNMRIVVWVLAFKEVAIRTSFFFQYK